MLFFLTFGNIPAFALECQLLACTHCLFFGCEALEPLRLHGTPALNDEYHIKLIQSYHKWCHVVRYEWFRKHDMEFCGYYVIFTTSALDFFVGFPCMMWVWGCECESYILPLWWELHCIKCAQNPLWVSLDWSSTTEHHISTAVTFISDTVTYGNKLSNFHTLLCNM